MKKIFLGFSLSFVLLVVITLWLVLQKNEPLSLEFFLQQRWPVISQKLPLTDTLDLTSLVSDSRPAELSAVDLLLAHYQKFDRQELQNLFALSQSCTQKNTLKNGPPKNPELQKSWLWILYTCTQKKLPKDFFKKPPFTFPSGQSYVQLAENLKFDFSGYLSSEEIKSFKSISEMMTVTSVGTDLNLQQINGFINGEDILLGENFVYLKQSNDRESTRVRIYGRTPRKQWFESMDSEAFIFTDLTTESCQQSTSNGCWITNRNAQKQNRRFYLGLVLILDAAILITAVIFFILDRRHRKRQKENQRFTLQMLTHELRTPVTTLALQLENIRRGFDDLNQQQQINFLNMSQEVARLKNSMQMSYAYLQTDAVSENKMKISFEKIDLNSFLKDLTDETIILDLPLESIKINAEVNWLRLCLNNLIKNALDHGTPPVKISLFLKAQDVAIEVSDTGAIQQTDLTQLTQPFEKSGKSTGLGLGLSIIRQVLDEMQGRLHIQRDPTRFTLLFRRAE